MNTLVNICKELIDKGEPFIIAKVISTHGSTPRKKGAWMIVKKDGSRFGSVGGGILEREVEKIAMKTFKTRDSRTYEFKLSQDEHEGLDMRCGGDVDIHIELIDDSNAQEAMVSLGSQAKVYAFGAGHVGKALEPILRYVGFSTVVIDDRDEYANRQNFPDADEIIVIESFKNAFQNIETDEKSYIVIMTRGHQGDYDILKQALRRTTGYIGMIGSKNKVADSFKMLLEEGFEQAEIDRVHAPIGTSILAETPEEIAISIAGEMIKVRARRNIK